MKNKLRGKDCGASRAADGRNHQTGFGVRWCEALIADMG